MTEQTIAAPADRPELTGAAGPPPRPAPASLLRRYPWVVVAAGLIVFSAAVVLWARTRPGFDPYGWLIWGYQTVHLSLDLGGAPSWKPLPFLFTLPYSLFGHLGLWMWMTTAVTISLSSSIFAGRIAYRLTGVEDGRRWPAICAAVFAGAAVLGVENIMHLILSAQSDPMIVSLCLAAIDMHGCGRRRWAFAIGILAGLGRPEVWSILGPYTLWLWREDPRVRPLLVGGWVFTAFMWFGVPTITNGRPFISGQLAERSPRMLHENKIVGTFHRFTGLTYLPIQLAALGLALAAWFRRDRTILLLAAVVLTWLVVEIAFVLKGWPGVPRYMFEPAALESVLAAVAVGWLLRDLRWLRSALRDRLPRWAGVPVAAVIVVGLVPGAIARLRAERKDLYHEHARTDQINRLAAAINHIGGASKIRACGDPTSNVEFVSIIAYYEHMNVGAVGHRPVFAIRSGQPLVLFSALPNGWDIKPIHTAKPLRASCASLNALWIYTRPHPSGVLVPR